MALIDELKSNKKYVTKGVEGPTTSSAGASTSTNSFVDKDLNKIEKAALSSGIASKKFNAYTETKKDLMEAEGIYKKALANFKSACNNGDRAAIKRARKEAKVAGDKLMEVKQAKKDAKKQLRWGACFWRGFGKGAKATGAHIWRNKWRYAALAGVLAVGGLATAASFGAFAPAAAASATATAPTMSTIASAIAPVF